MNGDGGRYLIRPATEGDLDAIAAFEVEIAMVSFGDEAITDAAFHRRRVANSLGKPGEIALVAVEAEVAAPASAPAPAPGTPAGWAWLSARTNSLTGARYGNFRSLAVAEHPDQGVVSELLMTAILAAADEAGFTHLTGKVNAANLGMRALYRAFGFAATHLTMEKRTTAAREASLIKCVIWDLDHTLFQGVYLETPDQQPPADPVATNVLRQLAERGLLQAIASRNPPEAAAYAASLTGHSFASVQCGWGAKSAAIGAILTELGLTPDEVAFIDDDAMERAEVSFWLRDVLVLDPRDLAEIPSWPQFSPPVITDEGRRRGELYLQRQARQEEAKAFGGSVEEFLRKAGTKVAVGPAARQDAPRLAELSVRTHQFNSAGTEVSQEIFDALISAPGQPEAQHQRVITARLSDRYGDDGLVGGCLITPGPAYRVPLLMMSCRAMGRGVIDALLTWICLTAKGEGASSVTVPCVINDRNVPLRIALAGAGFRVTDRRAGQDQAEADYVRELTSPLPELPDWVVTS